MPFKRVPQIFTAPISEVAIGTGASAIKLGGENVLPLYSFDAAIVNPPKVGVMVSDLGIDNTLEKLAEFFMGADTVPEQAKRASAMQGADFICLSLDSADPNGEDRSIEQCVDLCREVADAIDVPLAVSGCGNIEKDAKLIEKIAEALEGKNVLFLSAREENYKSITVSAGIAYNQKIAAESSVDLNLAKQLNVLMGQMGIKKESMAMNVGSSAAGYGFEYTASTMDRVKIAALAQNDAMLQMPIVTPLSADVWSVKEVLVSEEDFPEWGPREQRGIDMEISTAAACIASGSNAVILKHPVSVKTISKFVAKLM